MTYLTDSYKEVLFRPDMRCEIFPISITLGFRNSKGRGKPSPNGIKNT